MSHPFAHERDDGFGLVDVRVVTGIVQRHEGGVGIVRQQGLLIFVSDDLVCLPVTMSTGPHMCRAFPRDYRPANSADPVVRMPHGRTTPRRAG